MPDGWALMDLAQRHTSLPRSRGISVGRYLRSRGPVTGWRRRLPGHSARRGPENRGATPPERLDAAITFAPAGQLAPQALMAVVKGGAVVCAGIHMSDIPSFPYELLRHERTVCSVANLTRHDAADFLALAPEVPV